MSSQKTNLPEFLKQFDPLATLEPVKVGRNDNTTKLNLELTSSSSSRLEKDIFDLIDNLLMTKASSKSSFDQDLISFLDKCEEQKEGKLIDIQDDIQTGLDEAIAPEKHDELERIKAQNEALIQALKKCFEIVKDTPDFANLKDGLSNDKPMVIEEKPDVKAKDDDKVKSKNLPSINEIQNNYKLFIETVEKDPKLFTKRRLIKSQNETSKFTKGANFYEKTVVLPQIMRRLTQYKLNCEYKKKLPRKMVLDSKGTENNNTDKENNCKGTEIKVDVIKSPKITSVGDATKNKPIYINKGTIDDKKKIATVIMCPEKTTKSDLNGITELPKLKDIEKKILRVMLNPSTSKVDDKRNGLKESTGVTLTPEVLMEDCNKQRLIEFMRRRLFQSFVNGDI